MPAHETRLYYEAHITVRPPESNGRENDHWEAFAAQAAQTDWKASRFDIDEVDQYDGAWFLSARDDDYRRLMSRMSAQVTLLNNSGFEFIRAKIEDTLFDTKHGDQIPA